MHPKSFIWGRHIASVSDATSLLELSENASSQSRILLILLADFDTISKFVQLKVFLVEIKDAFILVSLVSLDTDPTNIDVLGNLLLCNIFEQNYSSYNFVDCILSPYLLDDF